MRRVVYTVLMIALLTSGLVSAVDSQRIEGDGIAAPVADLLLETGRSTSLFRSLLTRDLNDMADDVLEIEGFYLESHQFFTVVHINYTSNLTDLERIGLQFVVQDELELKWYIDYVEPNGIAWIPENPPPPMPWFVIGELIVGFISQLPDPIIVPDYFLTIQAAINNASDGDTVLVRNGTYYENVVVNKTLSLAGENWETTIIDGSFTGNVVKITTSYVSMTGFTIQNSGTSGMSSGICVFSSNNNLSHNIVRYNSYGIWLDNSTHSTVHGNSVFSNGFGVCLEDSNGNTISQNEVFSNSIDGIFLLLSHSNAIPSNNVSSNIDTGIYLMGSENNTISGNFAIDNGNGIFLEGSNHNLVYYNNASCNAQPPAAGIGINLRHSSNCAVSGNIALNNTYGTSVNWQSYENLISDNVYSCNDYGIDLAVYVANNTVCRNTVSRNNHGIYLADGSSNINTFFHNNFIDNIQNAEAYSLGIWDNGCEGNYWSDYEDKHPSANYDQYGIWNTSYLINTEGVDRYPLRNPYWNVGDLNRDLKVDIFDLVLMCACYCLDWQAHMCHVDTAKPYGVINIFDVVTVAINYGKEYSP